MTRLWRMRGVTIHRQPVTRPGAHSSRSAAVVTRLTCRPHRAGAIDPPADWRASPRVHAQLGSSPVAHSRPLRTIALMDHRCVMPCHPLSRRLPCKLPCSSPGTSNWVRWPSGRASRWAGQWPIEVRQPIRPPRVSRSCVPDTCVPTRGVVFAAVPAPGGGAGAGHVSRRAPQPTSGLPRHTRLEGTGT